MKKLFLGFVMTMTSLTALAANYVDHPNARAFVNTMVNEHKFDKAYVESVLAQAQKKQAILDAIARPAEKTKPWHEYREIFLKSARIEGGVKFWQENAEVLAKVEQQYGVPAQMIVAIIGVETRYGNYMGSYRVIDALTTLGFDYPQRGKFFTRQLEEFLLLIREQQQDPLSLKGSYAGAMGYGQFIPSSYRSFAKDFDGDGVADIWTNKKDAIASVANYFKAHGWQTGEPVAERATRSATFPDHLINKTSRPKTPAIELSTQGFSPIVRKRVSKQPAMALQFEVLDGNEYWLGYNNFYVITRYNRSRLYALAVYQLSEEIAAAYTRATQSSSTASDRG
ncbi:MAG TPA: lytic murein transglycosylase B [Marinagarivorans sp.]